ncbi:MAG: antibiotic biosynthesis monooxygenase [Bryobacteraceae bacterium]
MFVSITRLHLRSLRFLPPFLWITEKSARQLLTEPGFRGGKLLIAAPREFWTVTVWDDENSMREYRAAGAHLQAMGKLTHWCDEASVAHWAQETDAASDWETVRRCMVENGRRSKVNHPSERHSANPWIVPQPRWHLERNLKPRLKQP